MEEMEGLYFVGKREDVMEARRVFKTVNDRDVLIIYHEGEFYAMDSYCYHAAGKLQDGDIEECGGKMCIICPNHKYKIALVGGESLYKATDPTERQPVPRWYSKGVKQRTHQVVESNGDVYVKLSEEPGWIESDFFQGEKGKVERAKAEAAAKKKR
ncbi:Rieske domain-containing protein [Synchiropus picturatus]